MLGDAFPSALEGARRGDELAFAAIYRDVHPPLLRYLRTLAWEIAEESASEAWLEVARSLDSFTGQEQAFRGWVFAIARRKMIDRIRYESRRPSTAWDDVDVIGPLQRDIADDVVEMDDTYRALALVQTLPGDQAEAVLLRVLAELDYSAIAEIMGRSVGAVRVLVHRGLRRLARDLRDSAADRGGVTP